MTRILLSILITICTSPSQSFGQDYINFYDDVHPRPRWEDMPQSVDVSAANLTPEFWDNFFLILQNKTTSRNENIARSLGESLGDSSYYVNDFYLPGSMNARDRFMSFFFGEPENEDQRKEREDHDFVNRIIDSILDAGVWKDAAKNGIGLPRLKQFNDTGCNPENPRACYEPAYVRCISSRDVHGSTVYRCGCDFQHTEVIPYQRGKPPCFKNVFTQCTMGKIKYLCGENMECVHDTLHLEEESFCRCKAGFAPAKNPRGIPAFCRPIIKEDNEDEEQEDFGAEEAHAALILIRHSLLLLSLMATAAMT